VSSGPATTPTPPVFGGKYGPAKAKASGSLQPGIFDGSQTVRGRVVLTSTMTPLADANPSTYDFGRGITMTIAPGWTIYKKDTGMIDVINGDKTAEMFGIVGPTDTADITSEAALLIKNESAGLTNVQQDQSAQVQNVGGQNFPQLLDIQYTANQQTNQGTAQVFGAWVTLFNQSTKTGAFFDAYAFSENAIEAVYKSDVVPMINSVL
jgi:hypothetical protein